MTAIKQNNTKNIIGIILIVIGCLLFLQNIEIFVFNFNIFSWQFIFVGIGIIILINNKNSGLGLFFIGFGILGIFTNFTHYTLRNIILDYWPVILIIVGVYIIFKRTGNSKRHSSFEEVNDDSLDKFTIFQDSTLKIKSNCFKGGKLTTIFSDYKIDLRDTDFSNHAQLDSTTIFAGKTIYLRKDQVVNFRATSIFGGFEDKRLTSLNAEDSNVLVIKGLTLFGGIEIKD
ncbi:MAG: hypothetical protein CR986_08900 [Ignavibacteriae bacterium]|nr:MAG: hypothetical protein CR986_08900 [Ignavibacteriota bacterium]